MLKCSSERHQSLQYLTFFPVLAKTVKSKHCFSTTCEYMQSKNFTCFNFGKLSLIPTNSKKFSQGIGLQFAINLIEKVHFHSLRLITKFL